MALSAGGNPSESLHGRYALYYLPVIDPTGPDSVRGCIERNAIALLSDYAGEVIDPPSSKWLEVSHGRGHIALFLMAYDGGGLRRLWMFCTHNSTPTPAHISGPPLLWPHHFYSGRLEQQLRPEYPIPVSQPGARGFRELTIIRVYPAIKVDYTEYWQAMGRCRITTHQDAASVIRETSVEG